MTAAEQPDGLDVCAAFADAYTAFQGYGNALHNQADSILDDDTAVTVTSTVGTIATLCAAIEHSAVSLADAGELGGAATCLNLATAFAALITEPVSDPEDRDWTAAYRVAEDCIEDAADDGFSIA